MKKTIRFQSTTTHLALVKVLKSSFEKYGEICKYLSKNKVRENEWFIYVDLNTSFEFLINKPKKNPKMDSK